jgi:outer membrane protein OmpA-like peptidoglycan-associated protein
VLQAVRDRSPTEVTVFGYADSVGTEQYNMNLSAQRARAVAKRLTHLHPNLPVDGRYFADKSPLVPSPPGKPEPRNRRAEIVSL